MKYKIQNSFFDLLKHLYKEQSLKSFTIQPVHKGEEFYFDPETLEVDIQILENEISNFIHVNGLDPAGTFYPDFSNAELTLKAEFFADLKDLYCYGDNWDSSELYETVKDLLIEKIGSNFNDGNIIIDLDIEIENKKLSKLESFQIEYRDDKGNALADLSDSIELKNAILEFVKEWVIQNCEEAEDPKYIIGFSLSENVVSTFAVYYTATLAVEVVEKY